MSITKPMFFIFLSNVFNLALELKPLHIYVPYILIKQSNCFCYISENQRSRGRKIWCHRQCYTLSKKKKRFSKSKKPRFADQLTALMDAKANKSSAQKFDEGAKAPSCLLKENVYNTLDPSAQRRFSSLRYRAASHMAQVLFR